jgi:succinyl-diaminopimelate desuccinylase
MCRSFTPTPFAFTHPTAQALEVTLLWLCSIPSPIGEEKEICDAVFERMTKVKTAGPPRRYNNSIVVPLSRPSLRAPDTRRNITSESPSEWPADRIPHIVLAGHLDTVKTENGPARLANGRCIGAGAADMKSGLAVMIMLAETLEMDRLGCDLTLVFYAKEEGPYDENELGTVLEWDSDLVGVDLAVLMEPSDNNLHLGCNGSLHATITFEGKTAHSARPWEGENAITKAAPYLNVLAKLEPKTKLVDGLAYKMVTTVTQAKDGGRGRNVVPDRFTLNVNHRFTPDMSIADAERYVHDVFGRAAKVEIIDKSPAASPNANHPLIRSLAAAGVRGIEPKQAWTDVARFAGRGIPAVNFGPGENAQAHQRNESTSCALVFEGYEILRRWLHSLGPGREPVSGQP